MYIGALALNFMRIHKKSTVAGGVGWCRLPERMYSINVDATFNPDTKRRCYEDSYSRYHMRFCSYEKLQDFFLNIRLQDWECDWCTDGCNYCCEEWFRIAEHMGHHIIILQSYCMRGFASARSFKIENVTAALMTKTIVLMDFIACWAMGQHGIILQSYCMTFCTCEKLWDWECDWCIDDWNYLLREMVSDLLSIWVTIESF